MLSVAVGVRDFILLVEGLPTSAVPRTHTHTHTHTHKHTDTFAPQSHAHTHTHTFAKVTLATNMV